jgi:hypothetical protein
MRARRSSLALDHFGFAYFLNGAVGACCCECAFGGDGLFAGCYSSVCNGGVVHGVCEGGYVRRLLSLVTES